MLTADRKQPSLDFPSTLVKTVTGLTPATMNPAFLQKLTVYEQLMIFLFDIHSTIFDEILEYVVALNATIKEFINFAKGEIPVQFPSTKAFYRAVYADLKEAHTDLQSDWDDRAFDYRYMPTLRTLFEGHDRNVYEAVKKSAIRTRHVVSRILIRQHIYPGILRLMKTLQAAGHAIYLCTDANLTCVRDVMQVLKAEGINITRAYCCASPTVHGYPPEEYKGEDANISCLPPGVFKPNAHIVGRIAFDHGKRDGLIDSTLTYEQVFSTRITKDFNLAPAPHWVSAQLATEIPGAKLILARMALIGDNFGRDMLLAFLAGIKAIFAAYGLKPKIQTHEYKAIYALVKKENQDVIHQISYWEKALGPDGTVMDRLHLLNSAQKDAFAAKFKPDITCQDSITEIWHAKVPWMEEIRRRLNPDPASLAVCTMGLFKVKQNLAASSVSNPIGSVVSNITVFPPALHSKL